MNSDVVPYGCSNGNSASKYVEENQQIPEEEIEGVLEVNKDVDAIDIPIERVSVYGSVDLSNETIQNDPSQPQKDNHVQPYQNSVIERLSVSMFLSRCITLMTHRSFMPLAVAFGLNIGGNSWSLILFIANVRVFNCLVSTLQS